MQVAPSVCDVESLCTSNNLHFRSKHHKISLAWLRNVFTLFRFICNYITKPTTSKDANFTSNELHNFPTKFGVKFTTSFRSSWFDWQLRNEIAKLVVNFGNSEQTSEPARQKLCETLSNRGCHLHVIHATNTSLLWVKNWVFEGSLYAGLTV